MSPELYDAASRATLIFTLAVILYELFAFNVILLGQVLPASGREAGVLPLRVLFNLVMGLALWSFLRAHTTDPGAVPPRWRAFISDVGYDMPVALPRKEWQPRRATLCTKCDAARPERAHHCVLCDMCILRYDHHCPWINNCVGFGTHKHFLLLATYSWLASVIAVAASLPDLPQCLRTALGLEAGGSWSQEVLSQEEAIAFLTFVALAVSAFTLLCSVLLCHGPLACQNLTSVEDFYKNMPNPFDQGSIVDNLSQIFGGFGPDWFFPVDPWRPVTDGVTFHSRCNPDGLWVPEALEEPADGPDMRKVSAVTPSRVLIGDEEWRKEELWRLRYNVRGAEARLLPRSQEGKSALHSWVSSSLSFMNCGAPAGTSGASRKAVWI